MDTENPTRIRSLDDFQVGKYSHLRFGIHVPSRTFHGDVYDWLQFLALTLLLKICSFRYCSLLLSTSNCSYSATYMYHLKVITTSLVLFCVFAVCVLYSSYDRHEYLFIHNPLANWHANCNTLSHAIFITDCQKYQPKHLN